MKRVEFMKDEYRNPTQHPEKIYWIEEVQDLLNTSFDFINNVIISNNKLIKQDEEELQEEPQIPIGI